MSKKNGLKGDNDPAARIMRKTDKITFCYPHKPLWHRKGADYTSSAMLIVKGWVYFGFEDPIYIGEKGKIELSHSIPNDPISEIEYEYKIEDYDIEVVDVDFETNMVTKWRKIWGASRWVRRIRERQ